MPIETLKINCKAQK